MGGRLLSGNRASLSSLGTLNKYLHFVKDANYHSLNFCFQFLYFQILKKDLDLSALFFVCVYKGFRKEELPGRPPYF